MKKEISIIPYDKEKGIQFLWEEGFAIEVTVSANEVTINANTAGLISLAQHLISLAQKEVPFGQHVHLDEYNSLEENSCDLIIEKCDL